MDSSARVVLEALRDRAPTVDGLGPRQVLLFLGAATALGVFLVAVQLLGAATEAMTPLLDRLLPQVIRGPLSTLGFSWLAAYVLSNGSVVAALSLSLFEAELVSQSQMFLLVAGSRLGAASIVVVVGGLDFLRRRRYSLGKSVSLGLLAFLLTHSVYLPATVAGYGVLTATGGTLEQFAGDWPVAFQPLGFLDPLTTSVVAVVGARAAFVLAIAALFVALELFDRVLEQVDTGWLRDQFFSHLRRKWLSLFVGLLVTSATTSVSFSLGVVVPLYNRGYVKREEIVPYVLGANVGTLFDTLVVGVVLESPVGTATVLLLLVISTLVTLGVLAAYEPYYASVSALHDRIVENRAALYGTLVLLAAVPFGLPVVDWLVA